MNLEKETLNDIATLYKQREEKVTKRVILCGGTGCVANGAMKVRDMLVEVIAEHGLKVDVELNEELDDGLYISKSGCQGFCQMGPLLRIEPDGILYTKVRPGHVADIVAKTLIGDEVIDELLYKDLETGCSCRHRQGGAS